MNALLSVRGLTKTFATPHGSVVAVDGVDFDISRGETVALVGESGCGKSTVALSLASLVKATTGRIELEGIDLEGLTSLEQREFRRDMGIVFQNPYSSLNPKMRIREIVAEPLVTIGAAKGAALNERVTELLGAVGLGPEHLRRFPHEFSGGQRQRIAIARALALEPRLLILDEPTAALDVSVQAQVLNLLKDLQQRIGLGYLFISHNLATVRFIADRVLVMYLGRLVEAGPVQEVFTTPRHPYTRALLDSVPSTNPAERMNLLPPSGDVPSPLNRPPGCAFAARCPKAGQTCLEQVPVLSPTIDGAQSVACHFPLPREISS